jgi:hypothetical protein
MTFLYNKTVQLHAGPVNLGRVPRGPSKRVAANPKPGEYLKDVPHDG